MNSIESSIVLTSRHLDEADSSLPTFGTPNPDALKALRSLIAAPQNHPVEVKQSPLASSSDLLPEENHTLQVFSPTSGLTDSLVTELKAFIASKSTTPSPSEKSDVERSSESLSPDPALIEALRALLITPDQAFSSVQSKSTLDDGKDGGSMRVMELVQSLLSEERLQSDSLPLLIQVRDALTQTKGDSNHQPEALAQIRALIETLPPEGQSHLAEAFEVSSEATAIFEKSEQEIPNLGQAILQSLDTQSSASSANVVASVNQSAHLERVEQVSALMTEMADRVLVTDPLHGQTQEVRIQLAESIMTGTEVRVWRAEGGQLRVEFDTTSGYWARVLNEASPLLSQRLNERLNLPDAVIVNVHQQGGQPEDGRSRNRHMPWEVTGQEDPQ
ncbi:type III secretion system needle length determinant [Prosthecobacter fusiformis]|uniref:Type III secretion system needle length determinant n=1 Tax=Prosthecobacter fusiformis TaxID=48464 RepID=A0A4R7RZV9_9BACT|nr:hypothetical protein [Prosthecobacter fusiformis]TDU70696.1 type III secretion system needle length determinant [Prosthecobacter fusiformis]